MSQAENHLTLIDNARSMSARGRQMQTIDIDSAYHQFSLEAGTIKPREYVAFWISDDGASSMTMADRSYKTAEQAELAAQAFGDEQGLDGGYYQAALVVEE